MADGEKQTAFVWIGREGGQEMARRTVRAGTRFLRWEGHTNPTEPDAYLWTMIVRGDDGGEEIEAVAGEAPLNDTWLCPPICPGGG